MYIGKRVRVSSVTGPCGRDFSESLGPEYRNRVVGTIKQGPDEAEWYNVQFPTMGEGYWLAVHRSMIEVLP